MYDELARLSAEIEKKMKRSEETITRRQGSDKKDLPTVAAEYLAELMKLDAYRDCHRMIEVVRIKSLKKEE